MPAEQVRPIGAIVKSPELVHFCVWAPGRRRVEVVLESEPNRPTFALTKDAEGYFSGDAKAAAGALYRYRLDGGSSLYPDPVSRFQPEGPHGPSQVVDPSTFQWKDDKWQGCGLEGQVIYELHIGTFTPEGTWQAAAEQLKELAAVGITVIEVCP